MKKRFRLRITVGALLYGVFRSNHCSALVILMRLFNRLLPAVLGVQPFIGFAFLGWLFAKGQLDVPAGNPSETAIRVIRILGGVGVLLAPGFIVGGVMGLARAGPKGPFFFIEQAFYISTMGYPFLYLVCTMLSMSLAERNSAVLALLAQAAPIAIPVVLFILSKGLDKVSVQKKKEEKRPTSPAA
jgi:hypothetical protein